MTTRTREAIVRVVIKPQLRRARNATAGVCSPVLAAVASTAFALAICLPVSISWTDAGASIAISQPAYAAKGGNGGGNGGGKGGGNGGANGGGGNNGGNTGGGGTNGGTGGGGSNAGGRGDSASNDSDGDHQRYIQPAQQVVTTAVFTTSIRRHTPVNEITVIQDPDQPVSFFTELNQMAGRTVIHQWLYGDVIQFEARFDVLTDKWNVWSTQTLPVAMRGTWTVQVVAEDGEVLHSGTIAYQPTETEHIARN